MRWIMLTSALWGACNGGWDMAQAEDWGGSVKDEFACVLHDKDGVIDSCIVTTLKECQRRARVGKLEYTFTKERHCQLFAKGKKLSDIDFKK